MTPGLWGTGPAAAAAETAVRQAVGAVSTGLSGVVWGVLAWRLARELWAGRLGRTRTAARSAGSDQATRDPPANRGAGGEALEAWAVWALGWLVGGGGALVAAHTAAPLAAWLAGWAVGAEGPAVAGTLGVAAASAGGFAAARAAPPAGGSLSAARWSRRRRSRGVVFGRPRSGRRSRRPWPHSSSARGGRPRSPPGR